MVKEVCVKIKTNYINKMKKGNPIILKEAVVNLEDLQEEGTVLKIVDDRQQFIGKGYYGKQNKGVGWILTRRENEEINKEFFSSKISKAVEARKAFFQDEETTAFRVFNGEGDGIGGLIIDYYAGFYVINWYSEGIFRFQDEIIEALTEQVTYKGIYQKKRFAEHGQYVEEDDFVKGERGEFPLIVKENGINYAVYLNEGAMTGIFLDQREVRQVIRDRYAKGKTVLNTFSYTGAFSVAAALGGAVKTTSVDLANRSKSKTIEQFSVNSIDFEAQDIIVEDVFHYFKYAVKKDLKFDLVILDPPSFARSKKVTFSAAKDYANLLKQAIAITEHGGVIVASTNSASFDMKKFKSFIQTAFKESNEKYDILEEYALPEDFKTITEFPEGNYLKVVFLRKRN